MSKSITLAIALAMASFIGVHAAKATDLYWDADGSTTSTTGGTGTWNTSNTWRSGSSTGSLGNWSDNNNAIFGGTAGNVQIGNSSSSPKFMTAAAMTVTTTGYTLYTTAQSGTPVVTGSLSLGTSVALTLQSQSGSTSNDAQFSLGSVLNPGGSGSLTLDVNQTSFQAFKVNLTTASTNLSVPTAITTSGASSATGGVIGYVSKATGVQISGNITNNSYAATNIGATSGFDLTLSGTISGSAGLQFSAGGSGGAGLVTLNSTNTYTGATVFNAATSGTVKLGVANALPTATSLVFGSTQNSGILDLNGFNQQIGSLSSGSNGVLTGTITNNLTGTGTNTLTVSGTTSPSAFVGVISDGSNGSKVALTLASANTCTLTLNGVNTYTGGTTINGGKLVIGSGNILADTGAISIGGGTLDLSSHSETVGAVTITSGTITSTGGSGILTGSGALTKSGSANATIVSGATYSGGASITGGKLLVNGSISGSTSVSGSGTLGGTGTLGAVNVLSGGTISPGNGPGILTTGSLSLASGASMSMELNGTTAGTSYDRLITTGTVSLGGASLNLSLGYAPAQGDTFFLIVNGGGTSPGTFAGDGEGATFQLSYNSQNYLFEVTYLANSSGSSFTGGHDVALEVIPEPTTWIMLFGGFCTLVTIHRFRRQRSR